MYVLYPNALALVLADHGMLLWFDPEAVGRTRIHSMMIVPRDQASRDRYWEKNEELFQVALDEDYAIGEGIQDGMASRAHSTLRLATFERGIRLFHHVVDESLR